ncbi:response regulator [Azospirillum sp. TSA2s]|uniref:response regulator n=1 Tax=Azospirillum sp. TSA2s TaxID=709810 RepID=UPI001B3B9D5E|nr:response regulator [Azospirillum sp. TSA2s]
MTEGTLTQRTTEMAAATAKTPEPVLLVSAQAALARRYAPVFGAPARVETVAAALDRLRGVGAASGETVVLLDAPTVAAVEALARLDPAPAVVVLLPDAQGGGQGGGQGDARDEVAGFIAAGAQDALPAGDLTAECLRAAVSAARRRQMRENRLRVALAEAERARGEAQSLLDAAGDAVAAALDPMMALTSAALESPLLPRQQERLIAVQLAGAALRATLSALRPVGREAAVEESLTLAALADGVGAVTVEGGAEECFTGDAAALRALLSLLTAEAGASVSLGLRPVDDGAELSVRRRGDARLRPLLLAAIQPALRRLRGRLLPDSPESGAGEGMVIRIPVRRMERPAALSVLLVEDNPIGRLVAAGFFKALGHGVTTAEDGAQGLAAATDKRFDLIVMDVQMPVMDGLEASRAIRALPGEAGRVPIVALTAGTDAEDDAQCRDAGMDDCLHKPLTMDRLRAVQIVENFTEAKPYSTPW